MPDGADARALVRLLAWLSPAFPVGTYSYSTGLERAVHDGLVADGRALEEWLAGLLVHGPAWNDAVLLCEAWRSAQDGTRLGDVNELAEALAGSMERHRETILQGTAFLTAARQWPGLVLPDLPSRPALCVAIGAIAGANSIRCPDCCAGWLQAYASNLMQAAIRLSVTGQNEAVRLLGALEPTILATAERASASSLDDLGSAAIMAEVVSMKHETQYSRLFRS